MATPRIIGGTVKGMRLNAVPGDSTRPVTDRVKEAVFNIVGADIEDASMLDVFGGTGSIGLEALSRGADYVRFIENNRNAHQTLKANIAMTGFKERSKLILGDAFQVLRTIPDREFEYIYIAPPQYKQMWQKTLLILDNNDGWLSDDGWIIVQIHPVEREEITLRQFSCFDERKYGSTTLLFFERSGQQYPEILTTDVHPASNL